METILNPYEAWIAQYLRDSASNCMLCRGEKPCTSSHVAGFCSGATARMVEAFPELRRARGYAVTPYSLGGEWMHEHWWCVAPDGAIVDPTVTQFERVIRYEEYDEAVHGPLPTGKCPNCGFETYDGEYLHDECQDEYRSYIASETGRWGR